LTQRSADRGDTLSAGNVGAAENGVRLQPPDPAGMYAPAPPAPLSLKPANRRLLIEDC